jgi:hypothetical protein
MRFPVSAMLAVCCATAPLADAGLAAAGCTDCTYTLRPQSAGQRMGTLFPDPRLVAAIVDHVTFTACILETGTQSYRLATSKTRSHKPASCGVRL